MLNTETNWIKLKGCFYISSTLKNINKQQKNCEDFETLKFKINYFF